MIKNDFCCHDIHMRLSHLVMIYATMSVMNICLIDYNNSNLIFISFAEVIGNGYGYKEY